MKTKVDKLDVDKLQYVPVDFKKLIDVVEKKIVRKQYTMNWLKKR